MRVDCHDPDCRGECRTTVRPPVRETSPAGREPLPSVWTLFASGALFAIMGLAHAALLFDPGFTVVNIISVLAASVFLILTRSSYHSRLIERSKIRKRNLDRVEDWIIKTELPDPSPELAEREAEWSRALEPVPVFNGTARERGEIDPRFKMPLCACKSFHCNRRH